MSKSYLELCSSRLSMRLPLQEFEAAILAAHEQTGQLYPGFMTRDGADVLSYARLRDLSSSDRDFTAADCRQGMATLAATLAIPLEADIARRDAVRAVVDIGTAEPWQDIIDVAEHFGDTAYAIKSAERFTLASVCEGYAYQRNPVAVMIGPREIVAGLHYATAQLGRPSPIIEDFATGLAYYAGGYAELCENAAAAYTVA
ncbi:MAG TPA: hypothetical protein VJP80_05990 [Candidatus Saccharimonadales bacterium]|nr:hypothetical protein [Candidatus Saccharimonadales bacterium]